MTAYLPSLGEGASSNRLYSPDDRPRGFVTLERRRRDLRSRALSDRKRRLAKRLCKVQHVPLSGIFLLNVEERHRLTGVVRRRPGRRGKRRASPKPSAMRISVRAAPPYSTVNMAGQGSHCSRCCIPVPRRGRPSQARVSRLAGCRSPRRSPGGLCRVRASR